MAVLGAAAGLAGNDALDLDLVAAVAEPHLMGEVGEPAEIEVGERLELLGLVHREPPALLEEPPLGVLQQPLRIPTILLAHALSSAARGIGRC